MPKGAGFCVLKDWENRLREKISRNLVFFQNFVLFAEFCPVFGQSGFYPGLRTRIYPRSRSRFQASVLFVFVLGILSFERG
jgi:hypothetical protein